MICIKDKKLYETNTGPRSEKRKKKITATTDHTEGAEVMAAARYHDPTSPAWRPSGSTSLL